MSAIEVAAWAVTLLVACGCVWAVVSGRPGLALGGLVAAASFSGITASIGGVGVRLEQPAVVALALVLAARRPLVVLDVIRAARWPVILGALYLAANVASAILQSPDQVQSLKICLWLAISLVAGGVAAVLIVEARGAEPDRELILWLVAAGCIQSVVAGLQVVAELVAGSDWGVLRGDAPVGKAFGLAWEPNLLAINLAAALIFLLDPTTRRRFSSRARIGAIIVISVGIGLALSRGGLVALVAGLGVLIVAVALLPGRASIKERGRTLLGEASLAFAIAIGGYVGLVWLGSVGVGVRSGDAVVAPLPPEATLSPVVPPAPATAAPATSGPVASGPVASGPVASGPVASGPAGTTSPQPTPVPTPSPATATPGPRFNGSSDTIGLRWRNLQVAIVDGLDSPIIGLGPDTFGLRYDEPTCACPAHIPNQLSATLYESGLIGLLSILLLIGLILARAWRVRLTAYVASLVVLIVGYQFTDALRFASNWVLLGATVGLIILAVGRVAGPFSRAPADMPEPSPRRTPPR